MQANELREHADMLLSAIPLVPPSHRGSMTAAADFLRACAVAMDAGPVAWVRRHPDGTITEEFLPHSVIEQVRRDSGAWAALYTLPIPDQAQPLRLPEPMTDEEVDALIDETGYLTTDRAVRYLVETGVRRVKEANK